jgi:hypothetical protein
MSIPNATTEQLASQHRIEQRAADLTRRHGDIESTFEMDLIRAAADHLATTTHPLLTVIAAVLHAVLDEQDPHHPLSDAGQAAYNVAELVLGLTPRDDT